MKKIILIGSSVALLLIITIIFLIIYFPKKTSYEAKIIQKSSTSLTVETLGENSKKVELPLQNLTIKKSNFLDNLSRNIYGENQLVLANSEDLVSGDKVTVVEAKRLWIRKLSVNIFPADTITGQINSINISDKTVTFDTLSQDLPGELSPTVNGKNVFKLPTSVKMISKSDNQFKVTSKNLSDLKQGMTISLIYKNNQEKDKDNSQTLIYIEERL